MRPFGAKLAQWFRSYKHFSKKVKFPEQDHIPQLKKKNEFFTYFEGPEGVQKVITLYISTRATILREILAFMDFSTVSHQSRLMTNLLCQYNKCTNLNAYQLA